MGLFATVKNFKIHQIRQSVPMGQTTVKNFKIQIRQSVPMGLFATVKNSNSSGTRAHGSFRHS